MNLNIGFRLKPGRDDSIIKWIESVGENDRSYYIREALRNYLSGEVVRTNNPVAVRPIKPELPKERVNVAEDKKAKSVDLEANLNGWIDSL